jgi:hypothetical protein
MGASWISFPTIAPDGREVAIDWRWWQAHSHAWSPDQETTGSDLNQCQCRPAKKNMGKLRRWLEQCFFGVPWIFELKVYLQDELPPISSHGLSLAVPLQLVTPDKFATDETNLKNSNRGLTIIISNNHWKEASLTRSPPLLTSNHGYRWLLLLDTSNEGTFKHLSSTQWQCLSLGQACWT